MVDTTVIANQLQLVYPPVSNQEAEWIKEDPETVARLRESDFYVIGTHAEITFRVVAKDEEAGLVTIDVSSGEGLSDTAVINISTLASNYGDFDEDLALDCGSKILRLLKIDPQTGLESQIEWWTTDKLLYDRGRNLFGIEGLDSWREFCSYELLYIGIAKTTDTYERLFSKAHDARQRILSNEHPRKTGARTTDEVVIFPFAVRSMGIRTMGTGSIGDAQALFDIDANRKNIVADAEKAFVQLMKPTYNRVLYANYPRGRDGLYTANLDGISYVINENVTFSSQSQSFRGAAKWVRIAGRGAVQLASGDADAILVKDDSVTVFRSNK